MDRLDLLRNPTIDGLLTLTPPEFEQFVHQVFTYAGYVVDNMAAQHAPRGSGFDLHLHHSDLTGLPVARVECRRHDPTQPVYLPEFRNFLGTLVIAGNQIPGILVTTTSFHENVLNAASRVLGHEVLLIDGNHLCRYIRYLTGSRSLDDTRILPTPIAPKILFEADTIKYRSKMETTILTVCSNKGGVGKTTSAITLGLAFANPQHNKRVLLIDLDGQGNLTKDLPSSIPKGNGHVPVRSLTMADYILDRCSLQDAISSAAYQNVWIIPGHSDLLKLDLGGGAHPKEELSFIQDIQALVAPDGAPFDWIILDTPTTQSTLTRAACGAAHIVFIPSQNEPFALQGVSNAINTIQTMEALLGKTNLEVIGCITKSQGRDDQQIELNIIETMTGANRHMLRLSNGELRRIPVEKRVDKSHLVAIQGRTTSWFVPQNKAAQEYLAVAEELIGNANKNA